MKKSNDPGNTPFYMPIFMSIGISVGMAVGAALDSIPTCMSVGLCLGLGVGSALDAARKNKNSDTDNVKAFACSLCHNGILGGVLLVDSKAVTYKTQKFTVDEKYRNLVLTFDNIKEITWKRVVFPVAVFHMNDGTEYKFIVYNKKGFEKCYFERSSLACSE